MIWLRSFLSGTQLMLLFALLIAGCGRNQNNETDPDIGARPPGVISVPFRNRWWHFYERGLSWSDAGVDVQAEGDFRQCLALRQSDARLARTYGMHFVQCFAHRELGAVLLRQGRHDEAERELRLSLEQEPSAKAEFLLRRLNEGRSQVPSTASPVLVEPGLERVEVISVRPAADGATLLRLAGRLIARAGTVLWSVDAQGKSQPIETDAQGAFIIDAAPDSALTIGSATGPESERGVSMAVAAPEQPAPQLSLSGPDGGAVVADGHAWYRWNVSAAAGLVALTVVDGTGTLLTRVEPRGVRAAGTLRLMVPAGEQTLRFSIEDARGAVTSAEVHVVSHPGPHQDRALRAVAVALPLQSPRAGALPAGDDPRLLSALLDDGRFRLVDARADDVLTRELTLVEAGYVNRVTAAAAGRRLASRYVIAGTMNRGERDAECFLRLIHSGSGLVMATADAYVEASDAAGIDDLVAAAAGRLRQAFPVVAGEIVAGEAGVAFTPESTAVASGLMRVHVFAVKPAAGEPSRPTGIIELLETAGRSASGVTVDGAVPARGWGVSE